MYSQRDEEAVILREFGDVFAGRVLDIGAYDGRTFSNSLALIERGWEGVLVEASPYAVLKLIKEHGESDKVQIVAAMIDLRGGVQRFHVTEDALSSTEQSHVEKWKTIAAFKPVYMKPLHPRDLLPMGPFDFINIDVEGKSVEIAEDILAYYREERVAFIPRLYCVEFDNEGDRLMQTFSSHGYEMIHRTDENMLWRVRP